MHGLVHQTRFDLLGLVRNPRARFMTLAFPLMLLVILVGISGDTTTTVDGVTVTLKRFFVPGIVTMSVLVAAYAALVGSAVSRRETGVYKRRRATPLPAATLVLGQAAAVVVLALGNSAVLLIVARLAYGVGFGAGALVAMAGLIVLGGVVFACLGYAVASVVASVDAVQPAVQLTMLPLYFVSGIWFSTDDLPETLRRIGSLAPVEPFAHALHVVAMGGRVDLADLGTLAAWGLAGALVAARRFSWLPRSVAA